MGQGNDLKDGRKMESELFLLHVAKHNTQPVTIRTV